MESGEEHARRPTLQVMGQKTGGKEKWEENKDGRQGKWNEKLRRGGKKSREREGKHSAGSKETSNGKNEE